MVEPIIEYGTQMCPLWREILEFPPNMVLKELTNGKDQKSLVDFQSSFCLY